MKLNPPNKVEWRAVFLTLIMVVSMVAMSAAFAAPAAAATTDRTPTETTVSPGDTVEVTLEITADEGDQLELVSEEFDSELEIVDSNSDEAQVLEDDGAWEVVYLAAVVSDVITVEYQVPADAAGETYTLSGDIITGDAEFDSGTTTISVEEPEPGPFTVSNLEPVTANVDPDEALTVSADVTNTGDGAGASDVRLLVDGDEIETNSVDLEPGETESVPFTTTAPSEPGIYTHAIETDDEQLSGTLTVGDVEFGVSDLDPETATRAQGDTVDVSATITNTGDIGTDQDVRLVIDGETVDTQPVALSAGDATSVTFDSVDTTALPPGEYQHGIETDQDSVQGALTIGHSVVTYQDETGTVGTEQLRNAISDWRVDEIDTDLLRDVIIEWRQR